MQIISEIKVNGKWMNQNQIPEAAVHKILEDTICGAWKMIGIRAVILTERKSVRVKCLMRY